MPGRVLATVYDKMNAGPEAAGVSALRAVRPLYAIVGRGCHPNRDTLANIRAAGFEVGAHRREIALKTPSTENELLVGEASWGRPAAAQAPSG